MKKITSLVITLILLLTAGCQRKPLLEPHDHNNLLIKARFDSLALAQLLSGKANGYSNPGEPATTKYTLYDKISGKVAYTGSFDGLEGGMYVQEGLYDLLVYTTDFNELDANFFRGMDNPLTAETHTRQNAIEQQERSDITEMYMVEPDPTFSVLKEDVVVLYGYEDNVVEVEFVQKSFKYYLSIKATGLHNIHTAKMNIEGMYTTAFLTNEDHRMNESGIQSLDMEIIRSNDPQDKLGTGEIYGEFWSFGPNQREDITNTITLFFINGEVITIKLKDLTGQIKTLTRGGEIIVEEELEIKGPSGGFQPEVGDWNNTDVDIII